MKLKQDLLTKALAEIIYFMSNEMYIEGGRTYSNGEPLEPERDSRAVQLSDVARVIEKYMNRSIPKKKANKRISKLLKEFEECPGVPGDEGNYVFKRYKTLEELEGDTGSTKEALKIIKAGKHRI